MATKVFINTSGKSGIFTTLYYFILEFSTFLLVFLHISLQIETNPVNMRLKYFYSAVLVNSKLDKEPTKGLDKAFWFFPTKLNFKVSSV